jgi:murein DD-endopeptidase MepM/ murein hydrolase activator NlpD
LATLHHEVLPAIRPLRRRHPRLGTYRRATLAAGLIAGILLGTPAAFAAPSTVSDAQSTHDTAAADVAAIEARVKAAQDNLQRMTVEAEAASGAALAAKAALDTAQAEAAATARELAAARAAVDQSQKQVSTLGRKAYMGSNHDTFGDVSLLLGAQGPAELLQQAATLDVLGQERTEQLQQFQIAEDRQAQADQAAQAAVAERDQLAHAAADAEAAANAHLAAAQGDFDAANAEKTTLDAQLREAEIRLLALQGAPNPAKAWAAGREAAAAATAVSAAGGAVAPATGQVTSCYGSRWGTLHAGIDIAAPIGTPIYAPEGGTVVQAGPASGFGLAVALQHADGTITLYGHVNQMFVSVGQAVSTGQQIAEIGNRGQSTGPHLHFEVHTGGLYVNRVNPVPWLTARGISLGGGC